MRISGLTRFFVLAALFVACVGTLYADVFGSISGTVRDNAGAPLPGVTVTVTGSVLPKGRDTVTDTNGRFSVENLPPATYNVTASLAGLGTVRSSANVRVDNDTSVDLKLVPSVSESITVTAATPAVDMKSTEVNFNYDAKTIESLPLPRTYTGLIQLAPGVAESTSFAPNAGGSRQDNTFLVDGVSVTNPLFGYLSFETNELDVADFNVKRAGFAAEYGRSAGMVVNAVTKSGTNELRGTVRLEYQPGQWQSSAVDPRFSGDTNRDRSAFNLGGPIWRDHIFGYTSGRYEREITANASNFFGPQPDHRLVTKEWFGKVTANPTTNQFLSAGYRTLPYTDKNAGIGAFDLPEVSNHGEGTNHLANLDYTWNPAKSTLVEGKVLQSTAEGHTVADTQLGFKPAFNVNDLRHMGHVTLVGFATDPVTGKAVDATGGAASLALERADYTSNDYRVAVSQYFDFGPTSHELKAGVGYQFAEEDLLRVSNGWGIVTRGVNQNRPIFAATYYPDQPPQLSQAKTYSIYLQDSITLTPRLNISAGILSDKDEFISKGSIGTRNFLTFDFGDEIQPRIGVNYQLRSGVRDKIYANYGRYYNMDQKSSARSMAPQRLFTSEADFDATTGQLISDTPVAATLSKNISKDIKPTYTDEFLLGYATPLGSRWNVDTFWMYRTTKDFIEDFPTVPPSSAFIYDNIGAVRKYYAVTFDIRRQFTDRWTFNTNYTWSRLYGNYDQDYYAGYADLSATGEVFNTSSVLNDAPGTFYNDPNRWGPLALNRTHVLKSFASYNVLSNLTLGGYLRVQSGTPWEMRGRDWTNRYLVYLEPAGSHHAPTWTNFDLMANYRVPISRFGVELEGRVLNVFDSQPAVHIDPRPWLDARHRISDPPYFVQDKNQPNATFGKGTLFAPPRRYVASVKLTF